MPTKVHLVKAVAFPVVMYRCESWTMKEAEHWRIDAFQLRCWRRFLRVIWIARRSNQSILKEISPRCSLEGLILKLQPNTLATWCEKLTYLKRPWCWARLKAGGEGNDREWDGWMTSPTRWTWVWVSSRSWWWTGRPGVLQSMVSLRVRHGWATELNWTELMVMYVGSRQSSMTPPTPGMLSFWGLGEAFLQRRGGLHHQSWWLISDSSSPPWGGGGAASADLLITWWCPQATSPHL